MGPTKFLRVASIGLGPQYNKNDDNWNPKITIKWDTCLHRNSPYFNYHIAAYNIALSSLVRSSVLFGTVTHCGFMDNLTVTDLKQRQRNGQQTEQGWLKDCRTRLADIQFTYICIVLASEKKFLSDKLAVKCWPYSRTILKSATN